MDTGQLPQNHSRPLGPWASKRLESHHPKTAAPWRCSPKDVSKAGNRERGSRRFFIQQSQGYSQNHPHLEHINASYLQEAGVQFLLEGQGFREHLDLGAPTVHVCPVWELQCSSFIPGGRYSETQLLAVSRETWAFASELLSRCPAAVLVSAALLMLREMELADNIRRMDIFQHPKYGKVFLEFYVPPLHSDGA